MLRGWLAAIKIDVLGGESCRAPATGRTSQGGDRAGVQGGGVTAGLGSFQATPVKSWETGYEAAERDSPDR